MFISVLRNQLRETWIRHWFVFVLLADIDVVETKEIEQVGAIDDAQAEELPNAGLGVAVFELGQPAVRDAESLITFDVGDAAACLFDLANCDVAAIAKRLQLLTRHTNSPIAAGGLVSGCLGLRLCDAVYKSLYQHAVYRPMWSNE